MSEALTTVDIFPNSQHRYTVIWLHGLGADGHDFESIVPELHLPQQAEIHFMFPNAPVQPVTINGGMAMRAWYDILDMSIARQVDHAGITESSALISELIAQQIAKGIPSERILLAGFSQGGVIALHTGLRYAQPLAGIVALSTYLPTLEQLPDEASPANRSIPIFMAHGMADPIVPMTIAQHAHAGLVALQYAVQWQEYPMQHSVCALEISHIARFIEQAFQ